MRQILRLTLRYLGVELVALLLIGLTLSGAYQVMLYRHHLKFVPAAMGVWRVLYVAEESWGFGPGGNETGLIVYEMPEAVAETLATRGYAYLRDLPAQTGTDWEGRYEDWRMTPIVREGRAWKERHPEGGWHWVSPGIGDYLAQYGFDIPLDAQAEATANAAILNPGSFYAYGRIGLIVLDPAARRIIYAYAG